MDESALGSEKSLGEGQNEREKCPPRLQSIHDEYSLEYAWLVLAKEMCDQGLYSESGLS
jgi:hypothetical protein